MSPGGIRQDLICTPPCTSGPANVTYNQLFTVQPFNNVMTVKIITGDMIYRLLAQQFVVAPAPNFRILQVFGGFTYSWSSNPTPHVIDGTVATDGVPVDKVANYRVAMNNFLASGDDGFTVFNEGTGRNDRARPGKRPASAPSGRPKRKAARRRRGRRPWPSRLRRR
jgi:5'-nucleotidase